MMLIVQHSMDACFLVVAARRHLFRNPSAQRLRVPRLDVHNSRAGEARNVGSAGPQNPAKATTYRQIKPSSVCAPEKKPPASMRSTLY